MPTTKLAKGAHQFLFRSFLFCWVTQILFYSSLFHSDLFVLKLGCSQYPKSKGPYQFLFCWFLFCLVKQFLFCSFWFCSGLFALKLSSPHHPRSKGPHQFLFHWILFHWVTQFLFCSFLFCSDLFVLKPGGPQYPKSKGPKHFLFHWFLFCWVTQLLFCSDHLYLNWGVPTTQIPKVQTNFYFTDFCSAGSHNFCYTHFCSAHFCSALTFLHLNWGGGSLPPKVWRSQPIFIPLIFVLLWPFCT